MNLFRCSRLRHRTLFRSVICVVGIVLSLVLYLYYETINDELHLFYLESLRWRSTPFKKVIIGGYGDDTNLNSTCGPEADSRGSGQKVIAYAIYGSFSESHIINRYLTPLRDTVNHEVPKLYPGWVVRIYHNIQDESSYELLRRMFPVGSHVDLCNATLIIQERSLGQLYPMTWRFLPLLDELVDVMLSRDADSSIMKREVDAVQEWLISNYTFHAMRDAHHHCRFYILGGMWGVKMNQDRSQIEYIGTQILSGNHYIKKGYDQKLLRHYLWPVARSDIIVHDSACCLSYDNTLPFPSRRENRQTFVGMIGKPYDGSEQLPECPKECRKYPDWIYC